MSSQILSIIDRLRELAASFISSFSFSFREAVALIETQHQSWYRILDSLSLDHVNSFAYQTLALDSVLSC